VKKLVLMSLLLAAVFGFAGTVHAEDELDVTITVVDENENIVDAVSEPISLPASADAQAQENAAAGLATANSARELRREFGEETARAAREAARPGVEGMRPEVSADQPRR
jgi:hypothetical protein